MRKRGVSEKDYESTKIPLRYKVKAKQNKISLEKQMTKEAFKKIKK